MAILIGWQGMISLALFALFSACAGSAAVSDMPSTDQYLHGGPSRFVPSFDVKCGCNKTVTHTSVVLTTSIAFTNTSSYMVEPSQKPPPTTNRSETIASPYTTPMNTDSIASPTAHAGAGQPGYSVPPYTNASLISNTATSASQTVHDSSFPILTGTLLSTSIPGASSTSSFSLVSYAASTKPNSDSIAHPSTASNTSSLSTYGIPPLVPNSNTESQPLPTGSSSSVFGVSAVFSIPTDSTVTINSASISSQGISASTHASLSTSGSSWAQTLSSTSPGRIPVPLPTTSLSTWSTSITISASASGEPGPGPAYTIVAFTGYNTTVASSGYTSDQTSTSTGFGSIDPSSETFVIPPTETLTIVHSSATSTISSWPTRQPTVEPSPARAPICNSGPSHTSPDAHICPDTVTKIAGVVCNSKSYVAGSAFTNDSPSLVYARGKNGIEYRFTISWTPDASDVCIHMSEGQSLPSISDCKEYLIRDYRDCNNGGFGGWIEAGCLRFTFTSSIVAAVR